MRDPANGFRRIEPLRTPVNTYEKRKGRGCFEPRPSIETSQRDLSCALGEPDYGLLGGIGHLCVGACSAIEGVVTAHAVL
jgi:hypothetical protein